MAKEISVCKVDMGRNIEKPTKVNRFKNFCTYCKVPTIGWGKPFYAVMQGKLRAVKFIRIDYYTYNTFNYTDSLECKFAVIYLDVAGIGEVKVSAHYWYDIPFSIFESVEDFRNNVEYDVSHDADEIHLLDMLHDVANGRQMFKHISAGENDTLLQFVWDAAKCEVRTAYTEIPSCISYTEREGFYTKEEWVLGNGRFATREDCENANNVEVVEFEDDPTHIEKDLRKQIRTEVMRTFCSMLTASDIESVAESIVDECVEDVKVCSDYPHYNDSDVRLAIQRVVIGRVIGE